MDNLYSSVSRGGCYDSNHYGPRPLSLFKLNYLSEFATEAEKELVRLNLGIHNDSLFRKFVAENKILLDQIEGHELVDTIFHALQGLYGKTDYLLSNLTTLTLRIDNLDVFTQNIDELQESAINALIGTLPTKLPISSIGGYIWPNVAELKDGYVKLLYAYIADVDSRIGTFGEESDGNPSSVRTYIDALDNIIKNIIGEYSKEIVDKNGLPLFYNKYGGNNPKELVYTVKEAIDDLDKRLSQTSDIITNADKIAQLLNDYSELIDAAITEFKSVEQKVLDTVGTPSDGENASTGLYANIDSFKSYIDTELGNYTQTNEFGEVIKEASGIKGNLEEIKTEVSLYVSTQLETLLAKEEELESEAIFNINKAENDAKDTLDAILEETKKEAAGAKAEVETASGLVKSAAEEVEEAQQIVASAKVAAQNLKLITIKTREGVEQTSIIPDPEQGPMILDMGALGFYLDGLHLRTFAPGLGHSGDTEINPDGMSAVVDDKEYRSAFSLNYGSSDSVTASLKTLSDGDEYRIPTLEFAATNVEILDTTDEENPLQIYTKLKIQIVNEIPTGPAFDKNTFYFIKES